MLGAANQDLIPLGVVFVIIAGTCELGVIERIGNRGELDRNELPFVIIVEQLGRYLAQAALLGCYVPNCRPSWTVFDTA